MDVVNVSWELIVTYGYGDDDANSYASSYRQGGLTVVLGGEQGRVLEGTIHYKD